MVRPKPIDMEGGGRTSSSWQQLRFMSPSSTVYATQAYGTMIRDAASFSRGRRCVRMVALQGSIASHVHPALNVAGCTNLYEGTRGFRDEQNVRLHFRGLFGISQREGQLTRHERL